VRRCALRRSRRRRMAGTESISDSRTERVRDGLAALQRGEPDGLDRVFAEVYPELHELAQRQLARRRPSETLSTTALVHELYVKFSSAHAVAARDRSHFLAVAARAMRQIIIDAARRMNAVKRGGDPVPFPVTVAGTSAFEHAAELVALNTALGTLESLEPRLGRMVELRFFGGMTVEETAEAMGLSPRTVKRDWRKARAVLHKLLADGRAA
jgi:RNA polymerase sigma factor (TIGR02999 family)